MNTLKCCEYVHSTLWINCRYQVCSSSENAELHVRQIHCYHKRVCRTPPLIFVHYKKWFCHILLILNACQDTFVGGYAAWSAPWQGGQDTGVGRSSSSYPNNGILIENPLAGLKNSSKSEFGEFTSIEKYAQLLLTALIWRFYYSTK